MMTFSVERFWPKVNKDGPIPAHVPTIGKCWQWIGARSDGRGTIKGRIDGRRRSLFAHRVSWEIHFDSIPSGSLVCHKCDNPLCVNPNHLFVGTQKMNIRDCVNKGRFRFNSRAMLGERNGRAKFNLKQVAEIRKRITAGESQTAIAREKRVSTFCIWAIVHHKNWEGEGEINVS